MWGYWGKESTVVVRVSKTRSSLNGVREKSPPLPQGPGKASLPDVERRKKALTHCRQKGRRQSKSLEENVFPGEIAHRTKEGHDGTSESPRHGDGSERRIHEKTPFYERTLAF